MDYDGQLTQVVFLGTCTSPKREGGEGVFFLIYLPFAGGFTKDFCFKHNISKTSISTIPLTPWYCIAQHLFPCLCLIAANPAVPTACYEFFPLKLLNLGIQAIKNCICESNESYIKSWVIWHHFLNCFPCSPSHCKFSLLIFFKLFFFLELCSPIWEQWFFFFFWRLYCLDWKNSVISNTVAVLLLWLQ